MLGLQWQNLMAAAEDREKQKQKAKGKKKEESLLNNVLEKISLKQKPYLLTFLLRVLCGHSRPWLVHPWNAWITSKPVAPTRLSVVFGLSRPAGKSQWTLTISSGVLGPHKAVKQICNRHHTLQFSERLLLFHRPEGILQSLPLTLKAWFDRISQKPSRENGRKPVVLVEKPKISFLLLCCLESYTVQEKERKTENYSKEWFRK